MLGRQRNPLLVAGGGLLVLCLVAAVVLAVARDLARPSSYTPEIVNAISHDDTARLRELLIAGADANDKMIPGGTTPIFFAVQAFNPDAVELLLRYGANPNETGQQQAFLWISDNATGTRWLRDATTADVEKVVRLLVAAGVDPCDRDSEGLLPSHRLAANGFPSVVKILEDIETTC